MSTVSLILFVLACLFLVWQIVLVGLAFNLVRSGQYSSVRIGMFPLVMATAVTILGIVTR
jgi:hypothetical protein